MKNFNIGIALLVSATGAAAPSLQQELDLALRAGASVTLSQPEYQLSEKIILRNLVGGVIDGRGARITMTKLNEAIRLIDCRKVTLKNFILDYDPLPFTQGVVTELSPDLRKIHFQIDTGYPCLHSGWKALQAGRAGCLWRDRNHFAGTRNLPRRQAAQKREKRRPDRVGLPSGCGHSSFPV